MAIVVLGSINMDLVVRVARLPEPGETITGKSFETVPGGKGANQAVSCARLGAAVTMLGRVGEDAFGESLRNQLAEKGVDASEVQVAPNVSSGVALIEVDDAGENRIMVVPGANGKVGRRELTVLEELLPETDLLLLQLEVPLDTVTAAARLAQEASVRVVLDPAPAQPLPDELIESVDFLTPNHVEAATLTALDVQMEQGAAEAAAALQERGAQAVIVKLAGKGIYAAHAGNGDSYPAFAVDVVDTVAAGDAFNGGFAVALVEGKSFAEALRWGQAAAALAVTKPGAQAAMPEREEVEAFLGRRT